MLKTRIIPCLLFKERTIVKSQRFTDHRMIGDPTTVARVFNQRNADELIFLDIKASRSGSEPNFKAFEDIAKECFMPLAMGGGIRCMEHADRLFGIGADKVVLNSIIFENPELVTALASKYGSQAVVASIDAKASAAGTYHAFIRCGSTDSGMTVRELVLQAQELGAGEIFLNDIDRDGMMNGYNCPLIAEVAAAASVPLIAVGGCGKLAHLEEAAAAGADALSCASIFYFEGESIITMKKYLRGRNCNVRLLKEYNEIL